MKITRSNICILTLTVLAVLIVTSWLMVGCTSRLSDEQFSNQKPIVWFVNVPPEDHVTSVNPIINWVGQDRDGTIKFFRYIVVLDSDIAEALGKPFPRDPKSDPLDSIDLQTYIDDHLLQMQDITCQTVPVGYGRDSLVCDTLWTWLEVVADPANPRTSNIVPMSANINNPILEPVYQYIFVQAFDEEGLGSDVVWSNTTRRFMRIDNPPDASIVRFIEGTVFINALGPGGAITGVRLMWKGEDIVDYPTDPPPFEFKWNLFGPYSESEYEELMDTLLINVFVTNDAQVFRFGMESTVEICDTIVDTIVSVDCPTPPCTTIICVDLDPFYEVCDTTYISDGDSSIEVISCDTIFIDTITASNVYGNLETLVRVEDSDFVNSPAYKPAWTSGDRYDWVEDKWTTYEDSMWVMSEDTILYDVYRKSPSDTTREMYFIFTVTTRDDALVPDPTPDYRTFTVIDAKYEKDVFVLDMARPASVNRGHYDSAKTYWTSALNEWFSTRPAANLSFDPEIEFARGSIYQGDPRFLKVLLSHKLIVLLSDDVQTGLFASQSSDIVSSIYKALQSMVNIWLTMRLPIGSVNEGFPPQTFLPTPEYEYFFGVEQTSSSGWTFFSRRQYIDGGIPVRIEDFIGAFSLDTSLWPNLAIDTALLHSRYDWESIFEPWEDTALGILGALPEVNWAVRSSETEAMYLYESLYGAQHFLGPMMSFNGRPVAHRLNRGLFRTVHFLFTPMAFEQTTMQRTFNNVMDWLYDGWLANNQGAGASPSPSLSPRAAAEADMLRNRYWQAYFDADGDMDEFNRLLTQ